MPLFNAITKDELNRLWPGLKSSVAKYCDGKGVEIVVRRPLKKREQEKRFNAMITDIARAGAIEHMGKAIDFNSYDGKPFDVAKAFIVTWLEADLRSQGKSLKSPSMCVIEPISGLPLMLRASSSQFSVKECGWAIEFCHVIGAENKIVWSDPESRSMIESYGKQ